MGGCELNNARGFYFAADRLAGLNAISEYLAQCQLLSFAQIGWWDGAEGIWRSFFPPACPADLNALLSLAAMEEMQRQWLQKVAQMEQAGLLVRKS